MVYLSRIYTRSGDQGETGLGDGTRVPKDHARVQAYGDVDELNAILGLVLTLPDIPAYEALRSIQNDLFDVGADLCIPHNPETQNNTLRITEKHVRRIESVIDHYNDPLQPLTSFVLPGGSLSAAWLHLARTTCRRAERQLVTLMHEEKINGQILIYLNRLSDLFFVLARTANNQGQSDTLWQPGRTLLDK